MLVKYNGSITKADEIREFFKYVTKAPNTVVKSFFKYLAKRLNTLEIVDLKDLHFNYNQSKDLTNDSRFRFLLNIFGHYHLGNGNTLMYLLEAIEINSDSYNEFKKELVNKHISKINEDLNLTQEENLQLPIHSEEYQLNLEREIHLLKNKKKLIEEHQ